MKKTLKTGCKALVSLLLLLFTSVAVNGQSIFTNPINDASPSSYNPYTIGQTVASNMTASGIGRGPGISANAAGSRYNATNWSLASFDANDYFTFTLTPAAGYKINFVSFVYTGQRSSTGPNTLIFRSSADGFTSNIGAPSITGTTISLSAAAFQNVTTAIEFRVYAYGGTNTAGTYSINDFTFNGAVVPAVANPTVNTPAVTNINDSSAKISANHASNGGTTILERGFVWSLATNPLVGGSGVTKVGISGIGTGIFDTTVYNFPEGTLIYFKGYVRNSNGYYYTTETSFYTQSAEPGVYPSSFTATTQSKNSIKLDWTQVAGAKGYLIIQREGIAPTGTPSDKTAYSLSQTLGDGIIAGIITSGTTTTTMVNNLLQGTRYYFTLFPYGYNGVNTETYNYRTIPTIPLATDSTLGVPTSSLSVVEGIPGYESAGIPSNNNETVNTITSGTLVWKLRVKDGGTALNDGDDLPTIITSLVLEKGISNDVASWLNSIQSAALFDDSTGALVKAATITAANLSFTGINVTAQDNNYRDLSLRISLKKIAHTERDTFQFRVTSATVTTDGPLVSSGKASFTSYSDSSKNTIDVLPYKLRFITQPPASIEAGTFIAGQIQVDVVDSFNVRDLDYTGQISLSAIGANLLAGPRVANAVKGYAVFDTVRFDKAFISDTLVASSGSLFSAKSNRVDVVVSKGSDIIADGSFVYPQNILHTDYNDTDAVSITNSIEVMSYYLRDGGNADDNDFEPTILNSLTLNTTNSYLINKAALFVNGTKVSETDSFVSSGLNKQLVFSGFHISAPDNDSAKFSLRVTFNDSAFDGDQFSFTVASALADASESQFTLSNAGGTSSSTSLNSNRVDVIGRMIVFLQQPSDVSEGSIQFPYPQVAAVDSLGNFDNASRTYTVNALGSSVFDFRATRSANTISAGTAAFSKLVYDIPSTGVKISVHTNGLDSVVSNAFEVTKPTWFRSVKSGTWSDTLTWESSKDYGAIWLPANTIPDYNLHGQITIRTGDTVQMDGTTPEANYVDELVVEKGAVLITPGGAYNHITLMDGLGTDLLLEGKLIHNNPVAGNGINISSTATFTVKKGAAIELAAFGDAAHWAGNTRIHFEDSSFYIHNTSISNTIGAVSMFPNSSATEIPVFQIAQNYTYPGSFVNPAGTLVINGLLSVDAGKTFTITGGGERLLRNGISGAGHLVISDSSKVRITGPAQISGSGKISVNHARALFQVGLTSYTELKNNKEITTTAGNGISVAGTLNGLTYGFTGNGVAITEATGTVITAHIQGLSGLFNLTGTARLHPASGYVFNGSTGQVSGNSKGITARIVRVDNPAGLILSDSVTVTDTLFIGQNNITTTFNALLSIARNGVISGYSSTSFISGPLNMWIDSAASGYFPVGKNSFGPVTYHATGAPSWITLEYVDVNPNTVGFDTSKRGDGLAAVKAGEYWKINAPVKTKGRVEIPFGIRSAINGVDIQDIRVVSWNGSRWMNEGPADRTASATEVVSDVLKNYSLFTIGIDSACTIPAAPAFTSLNVCNGNAVNLTANGNGIVRWFINANDDQPFAAGNQVNIGTISNDTVFYTEVKNIGCYSNRVPYPVKINAVPAAPFVTGTTQLCYNTVARLTGSSTGVNNWYTDINSSVPAFNGITFNTSNLKNDTSFYLENILNGCVSPRTRVDITVGNEVPAPFGLGAEVCSGTKAILDATANHTIRWYTSTVATTPFFTGSRFTTAALNADTAYYIEAFDGTCSSSRVAVQASVLPLPQAPLVSQPEVCEGNNAQITATAPGTVYWYNDTVSAYINTGTTFMSAPLFNDRTYYVSTFDGKCYSAKVPSHVSVFKVPGSATITIAQNVPANQNTSVQTNGVAQHYEWDFGTGATPQSATGAGPHNVKWSTQGSKTVKLKMWNGSTSGTCSTEVQNNIMVNPALGVNDIAGANVALYPNPAVSSFNFDVVFETPLSGSIIMLDVTGKEVYRKVFEATTGLSETVNVETMTKGVYMVKLVTAKGVSVQKVIVQ